MILNIDSDAEGESSNQGKNVIRQIIENLGGTTGATSDSFLYDGTRVSSVIWECDDSNPTPGIPAKQTLERLVAAAISAAYPERGLVVEEWLAAKPRGDSVGPKSYGYSYLAKWYATHGADDFFRAIWRDDGVVRQLQTGLAGAVSWSVVASLVAD